jgi:hypothetical protein
MLRRGELCPEEDLEFVLHPIEGGRMSSVERQIQTRGGAVELKDEERKE